MHDFLCELQGVDAMPVLLLIDSWNRMDQMSSCKKWRSYEGLHAREMLVPSMLGADHMPYGAS